MNIDIEKYVSEYSKLREQYSLTWRSGYSSPSRESVTDSIRALVTKAADEVGEITDAVRTEWFRKYGCMNGWGDRTSFLHAVASVLHDRDTEANPSAHIRRSYDRWSCYHVNECSCGFGDECDSGD